MYGGELFTAWPMVPLSPYTLITMWPRKLESVTSLRNDYPEALGRRDH